MARPLLSSDVSSHLHHQLVQHIPSALPDRSGIWCRPSIARHSNSFVPSGRWNIPDPRGDRFCSLGSKEHLPARNASSLAFRNRRGIITQLSRLDRIPIPTRGRSRTLFCTCYRHSNTPLQNRGRGPGARPLQQLFQYWRWFRSVRLGDRYRRFQLARRADNRRSARLNFGPHRPNRDPARQHREKGA